MARTDTLGNYLTDVAEAIRQKKGTAELIQASQFDTEITNLPSGDDIGKYINLEPTDGGDANMAWWQSRMAKPEMANLIITSKSGAVASMFQNCKWTYMPKLTSSEEFDFINLTSTFQNCSNATTIDLSGFIGIVYRLGSAFNGCTSLQHLDIRNLTFGNGMSYSSAFNNVQSNCEIIVKSTAEKQLLNSKFSSLTNVKTAEEYEAE